MHWFLRSLPVDEANTEAPPAASAPGAFCYFFFGVRQFCEIVERLLGVARPAACNADVPWTHAEASPVGQGFWTEAQPEFLLQILAGVGWTEVFHRVPHDLVGPIMDYRDGTRTSRNYDLPARARFASISRLSALYALL